MKVQILVIDDENAVLKTTSEFLTHLGYEVKVANNGEEGIDLFNSGYNFDLVITDIHMPGMAGYEVAKHIRRSEKPDTPIVAITGFGSDLIHRELFNSILMKPFTLEALEDAVRSVT